MLRPRDRFDRYVIDDLLGEGGMGRVYRAHDEKLQRNVALKVLRVDGEQDDGASARLLREARAAASLDHTNTIAVYDVGESAGVPFIAMELVVGRSLRTVIEEDTASMPTRLRYLADVARALAAAHERGLLHRDIKPENVIVRADGVVKVLDFGIARQLEPLPEDCDGSGASLDDVAASVVGTWAKSGLLGTPRYMAPEQLRGERLDARADQFAWGVLAYELLTGHPPWDHGPPTTYLALVASILGQVDAPAAPLGRLPPKIAAVVRRALSKQPADRFPAMTDIIEEIDARPPSAAPSPPSKGLARRPLAVLEPGIELKSELLAAILDGFGPFRSTAWKYVVSHGLAEEGEIAPGKWISQERWFDVFNSLIEEVGAGILLNIGQHIPSRAQGFQEASNIEDGFRVLDLVYHVNHRKNGVVMYDETARTFVEGIGHYNVVSPEAGTKQMTVICSNPYPCELDHGILIAVARRFDRFARIDHVPTGCRTLGASSCTFSVSWE